jgi:hypothetical protein
MRGLAAALCILVGACSTTGQVDQVNALRARQDAECRSKGYKPGSPDYQTCVQVVGMNQQAAVGMAAGAAMLPVAILGAFFSDARLKENIVRVAMLGDGINLYRFRYRGSLQRYVGVLAQEVMVNHPEAVFRDQHGYLYVDYGKLGLRLMRWEEYKRRRAWTMRVLVMMLREMQVKQTNVGIAK